MFADRPAGIKNNTRAVSVACGVGRLFADYTVGIKNNTRAVLVVCAVGRELADYPAGIKNNTRAVLAVCGVWWVFADRSAGIIFNTRNKPRRCEELYPYTLLIRNHFPYNSVAIYHCSTPSQIRTTATQNELKQR